MRSFIKHQVKQALDKSDIISTASSKQIFQQYSQRKQKEKKIRPKYLQKKYTTKKPKKQRAKIINRGSVN